MPLLFAVIFGAVFFLGEYAVEDTVNHFMRQNALSRMQDWARRIGSETEGLSAVLAGGGSGERLMRRLKEQARHYNVTAFAITGNGGGEKRISPRPRGEGPRAYAAASWSGEKKGRSTVTVSIPNAHGRPVGHLRATVDQTAMRTALTSSVYRIIFLSLSAIALTLLIAWGAYRQITADANRQIDRISGQDRLTGLPNRASFSRRLEELVEDTRREERMLVYLHVNLDGFSRLGSAFGFDAADEVLRETARRLSEIAGDNAIVCRLEGDTFAFAAPVGDAAGARRLGERIRKALRMPVFWRERCISLSASIGAALCPNDAEDCALLERRAAISSWAAGSEGGDRLRFHDAALEARQNENHRIEGLLKKTVEEEGFELRYQPLVNLADGSLHGFEALIRMPDPKGGLIRPDLFIAMAERMNLMDKLGAFALREGCRAAASWPGETRVAINLSPSQFRSGKLVGLVRDVLAETGLAPERLEAEVTENLMLDDSPLVLDQLRALKALGINIVLDDFGTGYSSLNYLWKFPFDKIKIDRSFISAMEESARARSILRAMLLMARALNIPVTAEGIEDESQAEWLRRLRCAIGQGYHFGRPVPETEIAALLLKDFRKRRLEPAVREDAKKTREAAARPMRRSA